jgi:recombination protein RecA
MGRGRGGALPVSAPAPAAPRRAPAWALAELSGRLVELSAGADAAPLTAAFGLVLEAQLRGDRAAWVTLADSAFFPPDVADGGVDLDALPVVRVADARAAGRAADHLLRSGGFGLAVVDLAHPGTGRGRAPASRDAGEMPVPLLSRLLGLARQHDATVLFLTRKPPEAPSLHSLVSLRAEARRVARDGGVDVVVHALKDKRDGPGWRSVEACRGPAGLR